MNFQLLFADPEFMGFQYEKWKKIDGVSETRSKNHTRAVIYFGFETFRHRIG